MALDNIGHQQKKIHNLQLQVFKQILKLILLIQMEKGIKLKMDI
uniref:Uncharacterized protein n=1 Tax=Neisseria meningitidis alpha153 TaxID=663926 RepID=C6SF20_NEIME|nr:hypothetical protein predicted by Glimmer/Critica [Neisseria meningitidis alpha153]